MTEIIAGVLEKNNLHGAIFTSFCGGAEMGQAIACDRWIPLVSFTGSSKVGQMVQQIGNEQFGKCLVELSGNNAIIVMDDANIQLSLLHESIYQTVFDQLIGVYKQVKIGDHLEKKILIGGSVIEGESNFVQSTIVEISSDAPVVMEELFAPVLYVMKFKAMNPAYHLEVIAPL
ncbi:aldehyde dehydrogenase family 7 member A1-like isoform X3 [Dioscorea cayenensis subsp. rotundata]|uniref:aldehyde dehydrogenase (NAD(+)) n=1 Tax=Dioscorea cayennensis subsp. rotundata TaxID=55577 RepID=A0AB40C9A9_DIOCR|nr:aldehyde dehydrogenase family 7 member A1-like isoform X3 [Dioscorea cayenensis subsp. rotundata]